MQAEEPEENYKTGWIKIYRSLGNKSWFAKGDYLKLWIYLLMQATHKEKEYLWNGKVIMLKPGQFVTGRNRIANDICVHRSSVERMLTFFEEIEHQIEQQKTNTSRLISIINYDSYQTSEQRTEQQLSNGRATTEQRLSTKQEVQELKNDKNVKKEYVRQKFSFVFDLSSSLNSNLVLRNEKELAAVRENCVKNFIKSGKEEIEAGILADEMIAADCNAYAKMMNWIKDKAPRVHQMKEPLSFRQFIDLRNDYSSESDKNLILEKLKAMHNSAQLLKRNMTTYLTVTNWAKMEKEKKNGTTTQAS